MHTINPLATDLAISMGYVNLAKFTQPTISAIFFYDLIYFFIFKSSTTKKMYILIQKYI